jgi:hypothetical protein
LSCRHPDPLTQEEALQICRDAISTFGIDKQMDMLLEEMAELQVEIHHWKRGRPDYQHMMEEGVDLENMLVQLQLILEQLAPYLLHNNSHEQLKQAKLWRLRQRIATFKKGKEVAQ